MAVAFRRTSALLREGYLVYSVPSTPYLNRKYIRCTPYQCLGWPMCNTAALSLTQPSRIHKRLRGRGTEYTLKHKL